VEITEMLTDFIHLFSGLFNYITLLQTYN